MTRYRTIVADPPWDVKRGPGWASNGRSRDLPYQTMTLKEIYAVPVRRLAEENAHLYLWTINAYLRSAYYVAQVWGFDVSTVLVWAKPPNGLGLGGTFSLTTEFCLFARRGTLAAKRRVDRTCFDWPRGGHSVKPEAFLDLVEQVSPGPYLEMFARRNRLGWDTWGNEALEHIDYTAVSASDMEVAS